MTRNRPDNLTVSFPRAGLLIAALFVALTSLASCRAEAPEETDIPEATEVPQPTTELPEELAFLPEPMVVASSELTDEILEREAERTTAENALVVRYSREEFERVYGEVRPLEEQEWWQQGAEGVSPEEYLSSENLAGRTYLATVEQGDSVFTTKLCVSMNPDREACWWHPRTGECTCFPIPPSPDEYPDDSEGITISSNDAVPCEVEFWRAGGELCREQAGCDALAGCQPMLAGFAVPGILCNCPEGTLNVVGELRGE